MLSLPLPLQKVFYGKIEEQLFKSLVESSTPTNKARLLSVSSAHAATWLSVIPSVGLGLHLESNEYQAALRWWLGLNTSGGSCALSAPKLPLPPCSDLQTWRRCSHMTQPLEGRYC